MPVLPIVDLLILLGWSCLAVGGVLKAITITTSYRPEIMTLGPLEFMEIAVVMLLFALTLAARTWVKAYEPQLIAQQRAAGTLRAVSNAHAEMENHQHNGGGAGAPELHASEDAIRSR
jgi:hypothetical protein